MRKHAITKDIPEIYKPQKENANCTSDLNAGNMARLKVISESIHYIVSV